VLETVTQGFKNATDRLRGVRALDDENISEALRDVRASLLEADVDFGVVKDFLAKVKERALGEKVQTRARDAQGRPIKVAPGQHFVAICEEELTALMGPVEPKLARGKSGATTVMLVGLQGVGKTTVAAKLARFLKEKGRRPLLVAADIYRPAAADQLETLGASIDVPVHRGGEGETPPEICKAASERARNESLDAVIYDTAGRLAIDDELMQELEDIVDAVKPANTLLVCDALMGRDAVNVAGAFSKRLELDGIVMTKLDGDARGGAALSVKAVTGVPIKFLGTGESVDRLEEFRPEGLASRILGMGDIVGLVKDFEAVVEDEEQAEEDAERILKGQFGLDDLLTQLRTIQKLGPIREVFAKMPFFNQMADQVEEGELRKVESMIQSMTHSERKQPEVIDKSRVARIARGSGRKQKDVSDLLARFRQMRDMMAKLGADGAENFLARMPGMDRLAGAGGLDPSALMGGAAEPRAQQQKKGAAGARKKKRKQARTSRRKRRK
jgi:signal recognition particle subunit SRP54